MAFKLHVRSSTARAEIAFFQIPTDLIASIVRVRFSWRVESRTRQGAHPQHFSTLKPLRMIRQAASGFRMGDGRLAFGMQPECTRFPLDDGGIGRVKP